MLVSVYNSGMARHATGMDILTKTLGLWFIFSLGAGFIGPFGTYDAMGFGARFAYWGVIVAAALALEFGMRRLIAVSQISAKLMRRAVYVALLAVFVYAVNSLAFEGWTGAGALIKAFGYVLFVALAIEAALFLVPLTPAVPDTGRDEALDAEQVDPSQAILAKLPADKRGGVLHLEAQDHYLRVVTTGGESLILMRLGDASELLADTLGVQVHRSHWVAYDAMQSINKRKNGIELQLVTGETVPVSRAKASFVKKAIGMAA